MKSKILGYLLEHRDSYTTGQELSAICEVSRQSIHKHINSLKEEGYDISSVHRKGYKLTVGSTISQAALEVLIEEHDFIKKALFFESIPSTNSYLKANSDQMDTAIVVANEQTAGRGRLGRTWVSTPGVGLWQSILLRPSIRPAGASMLTQVAAVAMLEAIEEVLALKVKIKWPNDLLIGEKKVCGILTEMSAELSAVQYVVIGIGLNVNQETFADEISAIATSLRIETGIEVSRFDLLRAFLNRFEAHYAQFLKDLSLKSVVKLINERSVLVSREINVILGEFTRTALAKEINEFGELIITENDGTETTLYYGEVSVRIK
ncbi:MULTISPECIES: biotin--[acetyl-CoA-carboxylase] ligase [unclassified Fusibacter]|uniref:biotin--[acetyl-CoA-carboxylase] ligase n=1 Tax=unclassified Fusibacter TaxID=2624464 RepID=UPI0013E90C2A|nr:MULTISPECIES: biotin--[acetyl-CoA-carboxylase] ligase [unclassified Fusibacter]MCK8059548.1 biotin--[acetyl-CoA-carboxylase] ligase [Fusibacter sp. A2]NPE20988.1 biotin--[acetyl-CoA-carboxylase] ligase [Fusibacter sp. A1]